MCEVTRVISLSVAAGCYFVQAVPVQHRKDSTHIEADIFLQRSFWLRNLSVSPAAAPCHVSSRGPAPGVAQMSVMPSSSEASLLIALAPPGLNFTKFWISDVKARPRDDFRRRRTLFLAACQVSWNNLMALDSSPIVVEIEPWLQPPSVLSMTYKPCRPSTCTIFNSTRVPASRIPFGQRSQSNRRAVRRRRFGRDRSWIGAL